MADRSIPSDDPRDESGTIASKGRLLRAVLVTGLIATSWPVLAQEGDPSPADPALTSEVSGEFEAAAEVGDSTDVGIGIDVGIDVDLAIDADAGVEAAGPGEGDGTAPPESESLPDAWPNYPLRAMRWLDPGSMPLNILTAVPPQDIGRDATPLVRLGRVMFRYSGLLGGYAGRVGLSCDGCHPAGRAETAFLLPPLSSRRGHVDVTNALFSPAAENNLADEVKIPDLRQAVPPFGSFDNLNDFLRHTITVKFDGTLPPDPDDIILTALEAYLAAIRQPVARDKDLRGQPLVPEPRSAKALRRALTDAAMTLDVLADTIRADRPDLAAMVSDAYREDLGRIAERLHRDDPAGPRLAEMGRLAVTMSNVMETGGNASAIRLLARLKRELATIRPGLIARADLTFYDLVYLEALMAGELEPKPECAIPEDGEITEQDGASEASGTDTGPDGQSEDCIMPEGPEQAEQEGAAAATVQ